MTKITLENITEKEFLEILSCKEYPEIGNEVALPCGINVINTSQDGNKFFDNQIFNFIVEIGSDVAIGLFVGYLYDKLKGIKNSGEVILKIDEKETVVNIESIQIRIANSVVNTNVKQENKDGTG